MSKRKNVRSVADFFGSKRKTAEEEDANSESDYSSSSNPQPSKENNQILFDLTMEQVEYANEIGLTLLFNFDFQYAGTSSNQTDAERGDTATTSKLKLQIEGKATRVDKCDGRSYNVEFDVRVGDNGMRL